MATNQEILEAAARDGSLDMYVLPTYKQIAATDLSYSAEWPKVLENVLQRLHDVCLFIALATGYF